MMRLIYVGKPNWMDLFLVQIQLQEQEEGEEEEEEGGRHRRRGGG